MSPHELAAQVMGVTHCALVVQALKQRVPLQMYGLHGISRAPRTGRWRCTSTGALVDVADGARLVGAERADRPVLAAAAAVALAVGGAGRLRHHRAHGARVDGRPRRSACSGPATRPARSCGTRPCRPDRSRRRRRSGSSGIRSAAGARLAVLLRTAGAVHAGDAGVAVGVGRAGRGARAVRAAERVAVLDARAPAGAEAVAGPGGVQLVARSSVGGDAHGVARVLRAAADAVAQPGLAAASPRPRRGRRRAGRAGPASTGQQVPSRPIRLHERHGPWQATLQQTPSAQKPQTHWSLRLRSLAPFIGCRSCPFSHCWPLTHWLLVVHESKQAPVAGLHENGTQMRVEPGLQRPVAVARRTMPTTASPSHVPGLHIVFTGYLRQPPAPSHLPSRPQVGDGHRRAGRRSRAGSPPALGATHLPSDVGRGAGLAPFGAGARCSRRRRRRIRCAHSRLARCTSSPIAFAAGVQGPRPTASSRSVGRRRSPPASTDAAVAAVGLSDPGSCCNRSRRRDDERKQTPPAPTRPRPSSPTVI